MSVCRWPKKLAEQVSPRGPQLPGGSQLCFCAHWSLLRTDQQGAMLLNVKPWGDKNEEDGHTRTHTYSIYTHTHTRWQMQHKHTRTYTTWWSMKKTQSVLFTAPTDEGETLMIVTSWSLNFLSPRVEVLMWTEPVMHAPCHWGLTLYIRQCLM